MAVLVVPPLDLSYPTLGPQVAAFIEDRCVFGKGPLEAEPARLDDEKRALLYRMYEVFPKGHELAGNRRFHRCGLELRKGLAKTEFAAWVVFCELHIEAPVRCDGFDAYGNPVGRPVRSPYIPMMATTEGQVEDLAYGILRFIVENSPDQDLFKLSDEKIIRLGWNGGNAGEALAVSNAPGARDGARTTFQHFDEPHRLFLPRQREAHQTMNENLPKLQMEDPWSLYTSTAGKPGQGSIQEDLRAEAEDIAEGKPGDRSFFFFSRWAGDEHDLSTVESRLAAVADATGPMGEWGKGQFLRIAESYDAKGTDKSYWERVWLNRWRRSGSQAFDMTKVNPGLLVADQIPADAFVTVGFDGARFKDATAVVITEIATGRQQLEGIWERPDDADEWEVDEADVTGKVEEIFSRFDVWRMYCDPPHWTETVASWAAKYPDRVIEWHTMRKRAMADAARIYAEAIDAGIVTYPAGRFREDLLRHMGHAGRKEHTLTDDQGNFLWTLQKQDGRLQDKFDAAMAAVLSWQACIDARRDGAKPKPKVWVPRRIY